MLGSRQSLQTSLFCETMPERKWALVPRGDVSLIDPVVIKEQASSLHNTLHKRTVICGAKTSVEIF